MRNFCLFVVAVIKQWRGILTGSIALVLVGLAEPIFGVHVPRWVYVVVVCATLFWAFFGAWQREHRARMEETTALRKELEIQRSDTARPKLQGRIVGVCLCPLLSQHNDYSLHVVLRMSLVNVHPVSTTVEGFKLQVSTRSGEYEASQAPPENFVYRKKGATEKDEIPLQVWELRQNPLPSGYSQGLAHEGWLRFVVEMPPTPMEAINRITVIATDAFGFSHEVRVNRPWAELDGDVVRSPRVGF